MDMGGLVRRELIYGDHPIGERTLHIAFGIDANYVQPIGVAMASVLAHDSDVAFHVFSESAPEGFDDDCYHRLLDGRAAVCLWHVIDPAVFARFGTTHYLSIATYYRFIGGEYLHGKARRFLYLDADAYCLSSVRELCERELADGTAIAAVQDIALTPEHLGYSGGYFNAGVLLIDTGYWHAQRVSDRAVSLLAEKRYPLFDQDALNVLYRGRVDWLDGRWNCRARDDEQYPPGTAIVHFMGKHKPWKAWYWCSGPNLWEGFRQGSPWAERPLCTPPATASEHRFMSDLCRHRGDWAGAVRWYAKYLRLKLFR